MKARGALWAIGLFAAATACDNGNPAKVPEGQKTAIVTRQISGISDELLGVSAQNMSLDSSATSLTMVCPCYFGSKYMLDEIERDPLSTTKKPKAQKVTRAPMSTLGVRG